MSVKTAPRTIDRGINPFAPMIKQRNQDFSTKQNIYQSLEERVTDLSIFKESIKKLTAKINGAAFEQRHFGTLKWVPIHLLDINININRAWIKKHVKKIIENFDPRIMQAVNACYIKARGRYSVWEGQHTSIVLYVLFKEGLIPGDLLVPCKVFDDDLEVPGSDLKGEAVANEGFAIINGSGKVKIEPFYMHRSQVSAVRCYGSNKILDLQSEELQSMLERNNMFPAPAKEGEDNPLPGMVTYFSGLHKISGHDTEKFDLQKQDLERALALHDRYFSSMNQVDGGFILAFGRLYAAAREQDVTITPEAEQDICTMLKTKYGTPNRFHLECKTRLDEFHIKNNLPKTWSDNCLAPTLLTDYLTWKDSKQYQMPYLAYMTTYAGI